MLELPKLERFEIRRFLGRGGAGDVYLAWDCQHNQEVALKLVRIGVGDREILESERNGANLQRQLGRRIPQIVQVYDYGEEGGLFWVAMEYVDGTDLSEVLALGPLPEARALEIAVQLCDLLDGLQRFVSESGGRKKLGVVHGDIKPENIRLQRIQGGDRVRILDFGIAKPISVSRSFTCNPFGSLPYIPPERLRSGRVDANSDSWAVGIVLYRMVSGRLPFSGPTLEEVERQILHGDLFPLPLSCSRPLQWSVYKSLAYEPGDRYPTAAAMRADLETLRDGRPSRPAGTGMEKALELTRPQRSAAADDGMPAAASGSATRSTMRRAAAFPTHPVGVNSRPTPASLFIIALLSMALLGVAFQVYVWTGARQLQHDLLLAPLTDVDALWERYSQLDQLSLLGLGMDGVREEMKVALGKAGESIFAAAAANASSFTREEWDTACRYFEAILKIESSDTPSRARAAYCRAQLALVAAADLDDQGEGGAARRKRDEAIVELREAARLDDSWAAPHLSLAGIFAQSDLTELEAALQAAERSGEVDSQLVTALRADGELAAARRLYSQALRARGSEQEPELLSDAVRHLDQAVIGYREIPGSLGGHRRTEAESLRVTLEGRLSILGYW